jgi:hypothetical protein
MSQQARLGLAQARRVALFCRASAVSTLLLGPGAHVRTVPQADGQPAVSGGQEDRKEEREAGEEVAAGRI